MIECAEEGAGAPSELPVEALIAHFYPNVSPNTRSACPTM